MNGVELPTENKWNEKPTPRPRTPAMLEPQDDVTTSRNFFSSMDQYTSH